LNYRNAGKDRFRYQLKGFDKDWSNWSDGRKAVYTNLPSGNYTLIVEAYNLQSLAKSTPAQFKFRIRNPWWGIWYLNLSLVTLILIAAIGLTRKLISSKKQKQIRKTEIEKKIVQLEMQALQAQMNPHFIFNSINGIQSFVLANKMDEVLAYLGDFSNVVRSSLENATVHMVPLAQEIEFLHSYLRLEQMRFTDKFDYEIKNTNNGDVSSIHLPPMIIQPFAENAIRHGFMKLKEKGFLSIIFEVIENNILKCTVTDNGIGRKMTQVEKSFSENDRLHSGKITDARIHLFNSSSEPHKYKIVYVDLKNKNEFCGLKVELYLPKITGDG
jgi:LytS/YehU family sensor histidine kinase